MTDRQFKGLWRLFLVVVLLLVVVRCGSSQPLPAGISAFQRLQATRAALLRVGATLPPATPRQVELRNGQRIIAWETSQLYVREATGNNDGPDVEAYQRVTGNRKGDMWCGCYQASANYVLGLEFPVGAGAARNWDQPGHTLYKRGHFGTLDSLRVGDRVMFYYANLGRIGHIGAAVRAGKRIRAGRPARGFYTNEGNTGRGGGRDGAGVHELFHGSVDIYAASRWSTYRARL